MYSKIAGDMLFQATYNQEVDVARFCVRKWRIGTGKP